MYGGNPMAGVPSMGAFGSAPGGFGSRAAPMSPYASQAAGGMAGTGQWEEVYDSRTDQSMWINAATGEFTTQNPFFYRG